MGYLVTGFFTPKEFLDIAKQISSDKQQTPIIINLITYTSYSFMLSTDEARFRAILSRNELENYEYLFSQVIDRSKTPLLSSKSIFSSQKGKSILNNYSLELMVRTPGTAFDNVVCIISFTGTHHADVFAHEEQHFNNKCSIL